MIKFTQLFFCILLGVGLCNSVSAQEYTTLNVSSGFNADVIADGVGPVAQSTNQPVDLGSFNLFSLDFRATEHIPEPTVGLPINGLINAANILGLSFQLKPYNENNSLRILQTDVVENLVFSNLEKASKLYLLATATDAGLTPVGLTVKVIFTDQSSLFIEGLTVADWYGGLIRHTAVSGFGRVNSLTDEIELPFRSPKMFTVEINTPEEHWFKDINNIEISKVTTASAALNVFAVSVLKTPDCIQPSRVEVDEISTYSAKLSWRSPLQLPSLGFEYEVRTEGLPGSGTAGLVDSGAIEASASFKNIGGLAASTMYAVYLRSRCESALYTEWTMAKKFQTSCLFPVVDSENATVCGLGTATLSATTTSGTIQWYASESGGELLYTGEDFQTPLLEETRSYWFSNVMDDTTEGHGGAPLAGTDATPFTEVGMGVVFDIAEPVFLTSVDVYSTTNGVLDVMIVDDNDREIFSTGEIPIIASDSLKPNVLPINFEIQTGTGYRMLVKSQRDLQLLRQFSVSFPVVDPQGVLDVTATHYWGNPTTWLYLYFYNIKYVKGCMSPRKEVVVTVDPAPQLILSKEAVFLCGATESELITIVEGREAYDIYEWSPAAIVSGDAQNGWVFPATTTSQVYTLTARQSTGQQCSIIKKLLIQPLSAPQLTYVPESLDNDFCLNAVIPLEVVAPTVENSTQIGDDTPIYFTQHLSAFNNFNTSTQLQMLFTAEELRELGVRSGPINSIAFFVSTLGASESNSNYTVRMAPTNRTKFTTRNFIVDNFTTVYYRETRLHTASGWQEIYFDDAFSWNGIDNLIIELTHRGIGNVESANTHYTATMENRLIFGSNAENITLSKNRFNIKLKQMYPSQFEWEAHGGSLFVDADATIPYSASENLGKVYYKQQNPGQSTVELIANIGGCLVDKTFNINALDTPQPIVQEDQHFCAPPRVSEVLVAGHDIKWYRLAEGGDVLQGNALLLGGDYYVTQTINGCESLRKKHTITFLAKPETPRYTPRAYCGTTYFNDLLVEYDTANELRWYDATGNRITADLLLHSGDYYIAQANGACESERLLLEITINAVPTAPASDPLVLCGGARVSDLNVYGLPGAIVKCYLTEEAVDAMAATSLLSSQTYFISQLVNDCESARVAVSLTLLDIVPAPQIQNQNFCTTTVRVSDLEVSALDNAAVNWYNTAHGGHALAVTERLTTGLYYVSQTIGTCESDRVRFGVNVADVATGPEAMTQIFCGKATISQLQLDLPIGMIAKWYNQENGGEVLAGTTELHSGWYYVSQAIHDCESPRTKVEIVVNEIPQEPTGASIQLFENNAIIADIVTDQHHVLWFDSLQDAIDNKNPLSGEIQLVDNNTYYGILISEEGCWSEPFAVTVHITLGIRNFGEQPLQYYPNPVHDVLTVSDREVITRIELYSMAGALLYGENYTQKEVNITVSALPKATYIIKIYTATRSQNIKVVKR